MADVGKFTYGVARRTQKGGPQISKNDSYLTDTWTVVLPSGAHPNETTVTNIPKIGTEWDIASGWTCDQITWNNTFPSEVWTADVRYHSDNAGWSDDPDPGDEPSGGGKFVHREYQANAWTIDLESDVGNGRAVMNAAEDRFQDALTTQVYTTTVIIKSVEANSPASKFNRFQGTINDGVTKIAGIDINPHCGLLTINAVETDDTTYPWDVTYTVQVCRNPMPSGMLVSPSGTAQPTDPTEDAGFDAVVANVGYRYLVDEEGAVRKYRFIDDDEEGGQALAVDPHMLDELGASAGPGQIYWTKWQRYPTADWGPLNLPDD